MDYHKMATWGIFIFLAILLESYCKVSEGEYTFMFHTFSAKPALQRDYQQTY